MSAGLPFTSLAAFQDDFAAALIAPLRGVEVPAAMRALARQAGFDVYRNTVVSGCIETLVAAYPVVTELVGEEWMRAACGAYVAGALPRSPILLDYGASFPAFLDDFPPAGELPYLPDVARLDRAWTEAHGAPDAMPLDPDLACGADADGLASVPIALHPSARWHWCERHPAWTIWHRHRERSASRETPIDWKGEGALVVRRNGVVVSMGLDRAAFAFVDCCAAGAPLPDCVEAALRADPSREPADLLRPLLRYGALVARERSKR